MRIKRKIAVFLAFFLVNLYGHAAIPPQEILDISAIKPAHPVVRGIRSEDVSMFIPMNLQPGTNDEDVVMARVMDHSMNSFLQGHYFRNTELGRAAEQVEKALKTKVSLGQSEDENGEPTIEHTLDIQLAAFEQRALIAYNGVTDLKIVYEASGANLGITMKQMLSQETTLLLTHQTRESISRVNLLWNW